MGSADTTVEAREVQLDAYRAMSADQRFLLAIEMSEEIREITLSGLRERNPGRDEAEIIEMLIELWHGPELAKAVRRATALVES